MNRARVSAAALSLLAAVVVIVTTVHVVGARRTTLGLDAPGLAALSGEQLAKFLPTQGDFPAGWVFDDGPKPSDTFGYHEFAHFGTATSCSAPTADPLIGDAARVIGHASVYSGPSWEKFVQVTISRNFHPATLDELAAWVSRCRQYTDGDTHHTTTLLDNSHGQLRYVSSWSVTGQARHDTHHSVTQLTGLVVAGYTNVDQHLMDRLVDLTLDRIRTH